MRKILVPPMIIGTLGSVAKDFESWLEKLWIPGDVGTIQKTALMETAIIQRRVLGV